MGSLARFQHSALAHSVLAFVVYCCCPPFTSFDSYWTIPTAANLIHHGTTHIDEYMARAPKIASYAMECVPPDGPAIHTYDAPPACEGGHWYNFYPFSVSLFAVPTVLLGEAGAAVLRVVAAHAAPLQNLISLHPLAAALESGDWFQAHALLELFTAALLSALTVAIEYRILRRFLSASQASWLTLLFAFGTGMWSIASRSLLQHGPSLFLLTLALYQVLLAEEKPGRLALAAFLLAIAYTVRPSNALFDIAFTVYVFLHHRKQFWKFAAGAAAFAIPFFAYNLIVRHALLPAYFILVPQIGGWKVLKNGVAQLISPSRGVFIFTPIFLISLYGMWLAVKKRWLFPLTPYLLAVVALHSVAVSTWWPGHGYGSRYYTDLAFLFILFLVPVLKEWPAKKGAPHTAGAYAFVALSLFGVFVHARGAASVSANMWSAVPVSVDDARWRIWDWSDPQFLRGLPGFRAPGS